MSANPYKIPKQNDENHDVRTGATGSQMLLPIPCPLIGPHLVFPIPWFLLLTRHNFFIGSFDLNPKPMTIFTTGLFLLEFGQALIAAVAFLLTIITI